MTVVVVVVVVVVIIVIVVVVLGTDKNLYVISIFYMSGSVIEPGHFVSGVLCALPRQPLYILT